MELSAPKVEEVTSHASDISKMELAALHVSVAVIEEVVAGTARTSTGTGASGVVKPSSNEVLVADRLWSRRTRLQYKNTI